MFAKCLAGCLVAALFPALLCGQSRATSLPKAANEPPSAPTPEIQQAIQKLGDPQFRVRDEASQRLVEFGKAALPALNEAAESPDLEVRKRAQWISATIRNSSRFWIEGLRDPKPSVRIEAAQELEKQGRSANAAVPVLVQALKDKNHAVKEASFNALVAIQPTLKEVEAAIPGQARVGGRYARLLRRISVPGDRQNYRDFHDYGLYSDTTYAGHANLPQGYWVYVYPHWYIWGDRKQ